MLWWAGIIALGGAAAMIFLESRVGVGPHTVPRGIFGLSMLVALGMVVTHWLCKRNRWR